MEPTVSPDQPILAHRKPILILVARERNFLVMPVTTPTTASSPLFPLPTTTAAGRRIASIPACEFLHLAAAAARDRSSPSASPPPAADWTRSYPILSYPRTGDLVGERDQPCRGCSARCSGSPRRRARPPRWPPSTSSAR